MHSVNFRRPRIAASGGRRGRGLARGGSFALGIVALAGPNGAESTKPVFDHSRGVILSLVPPGSMLPPGREALATRRAKLLVAIALGSPRGRTGGPCQLSATAFLDRHSAPIMDILRDFLPSLGPDFMPRG